MNIKTYRAKTMRDALALVRQELGPEASVLRTREVRDGLWGWIAGGRVVEVMASSNAVVPSRLPAVQQNSSQTMTAAAPDPPSWVQGTKRRSAARQLEAAGASSCCALAAATANESRTKLTKWTLPKKKTSDDATEAEFRLYAELIEADVSEELARQWIERLRREPDAEHSFGAVHQKAHLAELIEQQISIAGPISVTPGRPRLAALVGPTGVGKTTTIAKLAANFRLREKRNVGLISVDTYRIAAVEQLRTYADIIDLPVEIVATPREMQQAVARMADMDLILLDTAGRSPRDELQLQELKSMLGQAAPDEVHLVLSSVASAGTLAKTAAQFAGVGATTLLLTKLDEALSLGNLLTLVGECRLPLSYLTFGQNVPDDILPADAGQLARAILGLERVGHI